MPICFNISWWFPSVNTKKMSGMVKVVSLYKSFHTMQGADLFYDSIHYWQCITNHRLGNKSRFHDIGKTSADGFLRDSKLETIVP